MDEATKKKWCQQIGQFAVSGKCAEPAKKQSAPHHYDMPISPIDFITKNGMSFCEGNVIKYISRYKRKGGKEDLLKARVYLDKLIEEYKDE